MNPLGRELIHNHLSNSSDKIYCVWRTLKRGLEDEGKVKVDLIEKLIREGKRGNFHLLKEEKDVWTRRKQRYRTYST